MSTSLLIGNGFAILASAVELASKGQHVTLLSDGKTLGGHFAGLQLEELDFDIGMVLLEECQTTAFGASLHSYDPTIRNDWTRFGDRASTWIRNKVDLIRAQTPECLIHGRLMADYLIANRLDIFKGTQRPLPLPRSDPRHASHKCKSGVFDTLTYAEAAIVNHGQELHQIYIEPFVQKVLGVNSADFLARFHRAGWVPLYYPETLDLAAMGQSTGLAEYPFWTTTNGFVGQLIRNIRNSLSQLPNVTFNDQPLTSVSCRNNVWTIATADNQLYQSRNLAIGMPSERISNLLGVPFKEQLLGSSVSLLFATVNAEHIRTSHRCTMIVDDGYAAYRLTDHDAVAGLSPSWHRIVIEASPQRISRLYHGKTVESALLEELVRLLGMDTRDVNDKNAIRFLRCFTAQNSLPIPTAKQVDQASQMASLLAMAAPGAVLTGSLLGFGVASLNDQLIQALKISEEFV